MRKFLAIVVCKLGRFVGKLVGKGSSMPGKFALKICPDILRRVQLPPHIIAVKSAGLTPEIRDACPRSMGRTVESFSLASNRRP